MASLHQPPADIGPHSAKSDNPQLHEISLSVLGESAISVKFARLNTLENRTPDPSRRARSINVAFHAPFRV